MLGKLWKVVALGAALWTLVATLAVVGSIDGSLNLMLWAVLVALVACMVTGWVIVSIVTFQVVHKERIKLERLAAIMAEAAAKVTPIR